MSETFAKSEKLCHKKLINRLFREGSSCNVAPFRCRWLFVPADNPCPAKLLITVPRHNFPKAVDRNLLKRRIREAYRRQKKELYECLNTSPRQLIVAMSYTGKGLLPFQAIQEKIIVILQRLKKEIEQTAG